MPVTCLFFAQLPTIFVNITKKVVQDFLSDFFVVII